MPYKAVAFVILAVLGLTLLAVVPVAAQRQPGLSDIRNATVTLYYYDNVSKVKGDIVPMPDNPQQVSWNPALAAPGMYTFSRVPSGQWYYLEADHNGNKWYNIFYMEENAGTKTANVHIPSWQRANTTPEAAASPSPTAPAAPATSIPLPAGNESPARATPGMGFTVAILAATLAFLATLKRP